LIAKTKIACKNVGLEVADHFPDVRKVVTAGKSAQHEIDDTALTRHACYLIAQNGDPRKELIAFAMAYFSIQTRKHEIIENASSSSKPQCSEAKICRPVKSAPYIAESRAIFYLSEIRGQTPHRIEFYGMISSCQGSLELMLGDIYSTLSIAQMSA
jgi:DNA-damage-inducible protein D